MTVKNETVTSISDLVTKLDTYLQTIGWTSEHLDVTTTAGTGGEWAMRHDTDVRFAASWDSANSGTNLALYHYEDQNYVIGDRPWGQDHDSGNGAASTLDADIVNERHVAVGSSPTQYWCFSPSDPSSTDVYAYIVVETGDNDYQHFGFGKLDKRGDWTGGSFVYGQLNRQFSSSAGLINTDGASFLIDGRLNDTADAGGPSDDAELYAATIHCEGLPDQPSGGYFAVSVGGTAASPHSDFGTDRQSNDGSSSDADRVMFIDGLRQGLWADGLYRTSHDDLSGEVRMWPIGCRYVDSSGNTYGPMGFMKDVFGCSVANGLAPATEIEDAEEISYYVFPANTRYDGVDTNNSGYLGIAYVESSPYVDPGLPVSLPTPDGWWSTRSSSDYTLSGSEITQLDDKSGNGNHFTVPGGKTGPDIVDIGGRNWADFPVSGGRVMSATNTDIDPGSGDFSFVAVYRAVDSSNGPGAIFGKNGSGNPNYGIFCGVSNSRSLYFQCRDTVLANTGIVEHDDAGTDYTDGTSRLVCVTYDDSLADLRLYGNDFSTTVDEDLVYASVTISPSNDVFLGDWSSSYNRAHEGEIAELLCFTSELTRHLSRRSLSCPGAPRSSRCSASRSPAW